MKKKVALKVLTTRLTKSSRWIDGKVDELISKEVENCIENPAFHVEVQPE